MGVPAPTKMVEAFAVNATVGNVPGGKTVPFPVASQIPGGNPGRASLNDGFTPANMTALAAGGVPMSGPDTNGILYLLSTTIVSVNGGMTAQPFDATYATAIGGYDLGAVVRDATDATLLWTSLTAANSTNPATSNQTAWSASRTQYSPSAPTAGTYADNVLPGASDFILDVSAAAGNIILQGFVPLRGGQRITARKSDSSANTLTIAALAGATGHQVQAVGDYILGQQYASVTFMFNTTANGWVII